MPCSFTWDSSPGSAGMLVLGFGSAAIAQRWTMSLNGLEGTWRAQVTVHDCQTGAMLRTFPGQILRSPKGGTVEPSLPQANCPR